MRTTTLVLFYGRWLLERLQKVIEFGPIKQLGTAQQHSMPVPIVAWLKELDAKSATLGPVKLQARVVM